MRTQYTCLYSCKSTTTQEVIEHLVSLFSTFGLPNKIVSDRGTAFSSKSFANFIQENEIEHSMTAIASPWANGIVERVNRFLKTTLAKVVDEPVKWDCYLGKVQQRVINNT